MYNGELEVKWLAQAPAPSSLVELMSCKCKKSNCTNNVCSCKKANLACTSLCECIDCENNKKEDAFLETDYIEESDDSDDELYEFDEDDD